MTGRQKAAAVVGAWFAGNAVLAAMLPAFGESAFAVVLYAASTALPAAAAVVLLWGSAGNDNAEQAFRLRGAAGWVIPAAFGLILAGVGSLVASWLSIVGALIVLVSCYRLLRAPAEPRREVSDGAA